MLQDFSKDSREVSHQGRIALHIRNRLSGNSAEKELGIMAESWLNRSWQDTLTASKANRTVDYSMRIMAIRPR